MRTNLKIKYNLSLNRNKTHLDSVFEKIFYSRKIDICLIDIYKPILEQKSKLTNSVKYTQLQHLIKTLIFN